MAKTSSASIDTKALEVAAYKQLFPHETATSTSLPTDQQHPSLPTQLRQELLGKLEQFAALVPELPEKNIPKTVAKMYSEQVQEFTKLVQENIASIATIKAATTSRVAELNQIIKSLAEITREENRPPSLAEIKARQFFMEERERLKSEFLDKSGQDTDFYYAVRGELLSDYARQLREGRIVQTPSVERVVERVVAGLELGETVFIHGDTGGGKTEVARVAAKRYSGQEPIVVRGYPKMAQEELFGHLALKSKQALEHAADVVGKIADQIERWKGENQGADETTLTNAAKQIEKFILNETDVSVLDYQLGAQYKAMKEGCVIIYDESNAFPDDLRKKLNDLKTKEPGEWVTIQEDGGQQFQVAKGYGEIETANIGSRYGEGERGKGRSSYSPDELDRRQCVIEYGYLPQVKEGSYQEVSRFQDKELFAVALAALCDQNGNIVAPRDTLKEVWKLVQFAALTQDAFSGVLDPKHELNQAGGGVRIATDVLISPRGLQTILNAWRSDAYQYELGHYVAENLLPRALKPAQRAQLYNLGNISGVFSGAGWPVVASMQSGKILAFTVELPKNKPAAIEITPRLEVIEALWGKAPERSDWPRKVSPENTALTEAERIKLMKSLVGFSESLGQITEILAKDK